MMMIVMMMMMMIVMMTILMIFWRVASEFHAYGMYAACWFWIDVCEEKL